jgi:hypothetical protein
MPSTPYFASDPADFQEYGLDLADIPGPPNTSLSARFRECSEELQIAMGHYLW